MVVAMNSGDFEPTAAGIEPPIPQGQCVRQIVKQTMPALLRLKGQSKGRIRIDVDRLDWIHLDSDGKRHAGLPFWVPD
jgi:hypothetical protein